MTHRVPPYSAETQTPSQIGLHSPHRGGTRWHRRGS